MVPLIKPNLFFPDRAIVTDLFQFLNPDPENTEVTILSPVSIGCKK